MGVYKWTQPYENLKYDFAYVNRLIFCKKGFLRQTMRLGKTKSQDLTDLNLSFIDKKNISQCILSDLHLTVSYIEHITTSMQKM